MWYMNVCYMIILNKLYLPSVLSNLRYHPLVPVISLQKSYVRRIAPLPIAEFSFEQRGNPICGPVPFPEFDCGETSTCADTVELPGVAGLHKNKDTACNAKEVPILRAQAPPPAKQNIMKIIKNYNSVPPFNLNQGIINEKNLPMKPLKETPSHEQIDNSIPKILFKMKPTLSNIRNPFLIDDFTRFTHRYKLPQRVSIKNSLLYKAGLHPRVTEFKFDETFESTTLGHRTKLFKVQFRAGLSQEVDSRTSSTLPPNKDPNSTKSTSPSFDFIRCQKLAKCNMLDWQNDTVAPPQPQLQLQPKILNIH
ncbi:uncharacterized protein LOC118262113 [Spodoptera frugiperda]|uniref:Uncharacterized protein LOC118262113 n=1 Tax=Spodoptera frugiperda TaxID=7108 RepID=A0A9R0CTW1_SPOFR|nr:uncharacterized protein LOC118262113 [Spodoptera frugiperda]